MNASLAAVGIIANPASGKDIRRLIAHATTVDNQGKVSILRRALVGLGMMGVGQVWVMPDTHGLGQRARAGLGQVSTPLPAVATIEMPFDGGAADSVHAARRLRELGVGCIIVLGGDGTVRLVAKEAGEVPLLAISTGTNNVLPSFVEGTIAGLAAGALAQGYVSRAQGALRHKWLEVAVNGVAADRALVDVAALAGRFVGARAVWEVADLRQVIVTRADAASIGISAIAAMVNPVTVEEAGGVALDLAPAAARQVWAALGPGLFAVVGIAAVRRLATGERMELTTERPLVLALDGEREIVLHEHDRAALTLRADGPWLVDAARVLRAIAAQGLLERNGLPFQP